MLGFRITMSDGTLRSIESDRYAVEDSGDLTVSGGTSELLRCRSGEWVIVDDLGTRLAREWPPDDLDLVVQSVAEVLGVRYGHYVHELRDSRRFEDWRMNDLDSLSEQFLAAVGIDGSEKTRRPEVEAVRDVVARHFHLPRQDQAGTRR
jgi:hypothetical protein